MLLNLFERQYLAYDKKKYTYRKMRPAFSSAYLIRIIRHKMRRPAPETHASLMMLFNELRRKIYS
jgi:hypothetical protein